MNTHEKNQQRNYGIDLLRLVAAFYVVVLHVMCQGGLYGATALYSYQNYIARLLLIFCFCAVNIFGIISGYVGYRETEKPASLSGFLQLWLSVVFYGAVICGGYMLFHPGTASWQDLVSMFFPLTKNLYWYFSAYSLVYFLGPYLNRFLRSASDAALKRCFFLICFVIVPLECLKSAFSMAGGYSALWLLILYLLGGIMKKTGIGSHISSAIAALSILMLDLASFYLGIRLPETRFFIFDITFEVSFSHITPVYLASAILHVILFSRLRFRPWIQKLIAFAAPAAFYIYIANVQDTFWKHFMTNRFIPWASGSPAGILVRTVAFSAVFVMAVILADPFRRKLFRLLGVKAWCQKLSCAFSKETAR